MPIIVEDFIEALSDMNYGAQHFVKEGDAEHGEINRVYLQSGSKHIKAYVDVSGEVPRFNVWAEFPEGHKVGGKGEGLTGKALKAHNVKCAALTRADLIGAVTVAMMAAGAELGEIAEGCGLHNEEKRYAPYDPEAEDKPKAAAPASAPSM